MKPRTLRTGTELADVLEQENQALRTMDLARAAGLYPRKQEATIAFGEAQQQEADLMDKVLDQEQQRLARELAERLRALAEENKRLLERAINVQAHVLGTIGRAMAQAVPSRQPTRYVGSGIIASTPRQAPVVLSAHA